MTFDDIALFEPSWVSFDDAAALKEPIALMTGARIRRNLKDHPFTTTCDKSLLFDTAALALGAMGRCDQWTSCDFRMIDSLDELSRSILVENRTISKRLSVGGAGRFFMRDDNASVSCMINECDHLCLTASFPGLSAEKAYSTASSFIDSVALDTACDPVLGFLTVSPKYVGTGLQVFVMLHMPALDASGETGRVSAAFERDHSKVALCRMTSEKKNTIGSFYYIINKITLGLTAEEITEQVSAAAKYLVSKELFARHKMTHSKSYDISDRFWRAWGLLRHARKLSYTEAANRASFVKLGSDLGVLPRVDERYWRRMIIGTQSNHISLANGRRVDSSEEPFDRAAMYRAFIESSGIPSSDVPNTAAENRNPRSCL